MKKILCILLVWLTIAALPALAEENPFAPYCLTVPDSVELTETEGTFTFVHGKTRVVAMVIERVPDENPGGAIIRMMGQFEPDAVIGDDLSMVEGFVGLQAVNQDRFGEGLDQLNVMVLGSDGNLLILSGHDLDGDEEQVRLLLDTLLSTLTVDGVKIVQSKE